MDLRGDEEVILKKISKLQQQLVRCFFSPAVGFEDVFFRPCDNYHHWKHIGFEAFEILFFQRYYYVISCFIVSLF